MALSIVVKSVNSTLMFVVVPFRRHLNTKVTSTLFCYRNQALQDNAKAVIFGRIMCLYVMSDDFAIDCGCANLPSTAWHMYDKHPLCLGYSVEGDLREHGCDICKEKRSPKQWFYYCDDCDFAAHSYCVIGKSKRIKFGGTFQYDAHPQHPLALVEEVEKQPQPPCEACRERCTGWTLECGDCKWYMHKEGRCFWEQFKQSTEYLAFSGTMRDRYAANVLAATPNVSTK